MTKVAHVFTLTSCKRTPKLPGKSPKLTTIKQLGTYPSRPRPMHLQTVNIDD